MNRTTRRIVAVLGAMGLVGLVGLAWPWGQLPALGAGGLLHPARHATALAPPEHCVAGEFPGAGVTLKGWRCQAAAPARGTIIYLHGIADNRGSATGVIQRFVARGFDVIAYDSRAHGDSDGDACTYGFFGEAGSPSRDRHVSAGPVAGSTSLGAAVALQEAAGRSPRQRSSPRRRSRFANGRDRTRAALFHQRRDRPRLRRRRRRGALPG